MFDRTISTDSNRKGLFSFRTPKFRNKLQIITENASDSSVHRRPSEIKSKCVSNNSNPDKVSFLLNSFGCLGFHSQSKCDNAYKQILYLPKIDPSYFGTLRSGMLAFGF